MRTSLKIILVDPNLVRTFLAILFFDPTYSAHSSGNYRVQIHSETLRDMITYSYSIPGSLVITKPFQNLSQLQALL